MAPRVYARLAGVFFLLEATTAVFGQIIVPGRLVVAGNAAATAANILAHESLWRLGFASALTAAAFHVAWALLFYELLKPVNKHVSLLATFVMLVGCALQAAAAILLIAPLLVLEAGSTLSAFSSGQLQALAYVFLRLNVQAFNSHLVIFGLWCLLVGYLSVREPQDEQRRLDRALPRVGRRAAVQLVGYGPILTGRLFRRIACRSVSCAAPVVPGPASGYTGVAMSGSTARRAWALVVPLLLTGCAGGQARETAGEPIVGGPCEGCEAVFVGLPEEVPCHARIAPPDEPGEALRIEGRVLRPDGRPAPGVIVYAYQTNADGIYPRDRRLRGAAARHGALRGWARADDEGRYRFDTVRPGGYPGSDMPQHIHMHVLEPGRCTYYIDDVVFRDDPRLTGEKLAIYAPGRGGSGVVMPRPSGPAAWIATRDIILGEKIPGYPPLEPAETP